MKFLNLKKNETELRQNKNTE